MSTTAYKIFVMQASENGHVIEILHEKYWYANDIFPKKDSKYQEMAWNWQLYNYRIKLPTGWEYVIENGDIAFRLPKINEECLVFDDDLNDYVPSVRLNIFSTTKHPIIKRIDNSEV